MRLILLILLGSFSCSKIQDSSGLEDKLHGGNVKRWEHIAYNNTYYGDKPSGFIILTNKNFYRPYTYYKNGSYDRKNSGDVVIPEYYKLINDTLLYIGNNYFKIEKLTNDSLIISGFCGPNSSIFISSTNVIPPDL